ncbi:ER degradation-enhancing alpha-mannosidase-like protein 3 [Frankliniella fusca]|uniref:alpha-1,2-Mannosidase n=1 Tax=Frankliniella fusca TaxID=407009 RepID=A0AAE1LIT8_9NEOP|nr:ER degradation-enhancing alpha-mannosidase-like protein 3 [Frankliniella fusca]
MEGYASLHLTVLLSLLLSTFICVMGLTSPPLISPDERLELREEARDMFYHAFNAYMENAYPADELMPLSCKGRWRGKEPSRGDIDDTLGNFSLTLIDTLDTLVVLGDIDEFERAAKLIIKDVSFDSDIIVSVFETNIRVLGGLLSGHILAEYLQLNMNVMHWYRGELLQLAKDIGFRLLPAFNTTTGIPHARVNLRHGLKVRGLESSRETCTACAGTMILEMAALSRLSGEPIFEEKAHRAMDELWRLRHRSSDLMGTVLNIHSGDWVRRDSGVGAGIDSYYEYCLKAYILLGDDRYLGRFNKHYSAVMRYISQGPMLLDVHMHRPNSNSRNFMDALLAFWPGLQVLKGDIKPAVETHEMLYQVMQRHNFLPEAFTTDFQVHWGQHPLRPEFLESTYFLYKATGDSYYLEVGRKVLKSLQRYARVSCGYAAVKDVRTNVHEDRMDSFVLAETFKYLFLLFSEPNELLLDLDQFLFTTEAHLLPLTLARSTNASLLNQIVNSMDLNGSDLSGDDLTDARTCPNIQHLFPEKVRRPLRNLVDGVCPHKELRRRLKAVDFQMGNTDHLKLLKEMGISIMGLDDGRVQLVHAFGNAASTVDAEEGLIFMQEMVELSKFTPQTETMQQAVSFSDYQGKLTVIPAGPAHFGKILRLPSDKVTAKVGVALPVRGCETLNWPQMLSGRIVILERGDCMFVEKARRIQKAGAVAGIVIDHTVGTSVTKSTMFAMSGDGVDDVSIPMAFLFYDDAVRLLEAIQKTPDIDVTLSSFAALEEGTRGQFQGKEVTLEPPSKHSALDKIKESIIKFINNPIQTKSFGSENKPNVPVLQPPKSFSEENAPVSSAPTHKSKIPHLNELLLSIVLQSDDLVLQGVLKHDSPIPNELFAKLKDKIPKKNLQLFSTLAQQGLFTLNEDTIQSLDLDYLSNLNNIDSKVEMKNQEPLPHFGSATPVPLHSVLQESKEGTEDLCVNCNSKEAVDNEQVLNIDFPVLRPPTSKSEPIEESKQRTTLDKLRFPDEL